MCVDGAMDVCVQAYLQNRQRAFDECYNLSRTQHNKNKDIPEGGAKGVILLPQTSGIAVRHERQPTERP